MELPSSVTTRHIADQYATQAVLVELIRYLAQSDPQIFFALQSATQGRVLKPVDDDVIVSEQYVRDSFEAILDKARQV
jgi:hypothetical protein